MASAGKCTRIASAGSDNDSGRHERDNARREIHGDYASQNRPLNDDSRITMYQW